MIGLDTNVLLRWLIDESVWPDDRSGQVEAVRDLVVGGKTPFFINHIVIAEMVWVLANPMGQPESVLIDILDRLLSAANVVIDRRDAVAAALDGYRNGKPGFTDHLIGHVNRHAGCETTVSFDKAAGRAGTFRRLQPRSP